MLPGGNPNSGMDDIEDESAPLIPSAGSSGLASSGAPLGSPFGAVLVGTSSSSDNVMQLSSSDSKHSLLSSLSIMSPQSSKVGALALISCFWIFTSIYIFSGGDSRAGHSRPWYSSRSALYGANFNGNSQLSEPTFAIVSDQDQRSRVQPDVMLFASTLKTGKLVSVPGSGYQVVWLDEMRLQSKLNEEGRGMELSELWRFHNRLYSCDDRTGVVYEVLMKERAVAPRYILADGHGDVTKGFKCEWAFVRDGEVTIGSMGKEFVRDGKIVSDSPTWVKRIDADGRLHHVAWSPVFDSLRSAVPGARHPGYLLHEAVCWNDVHRELYFIPRRFSADPYEESVDAYRGTNLVIKVSDKLEVQEVMKFEGDTNGGLRGVSSCKVNPLNPEEIVLLKTEELENDTKSFISVISRRTGKAVMPDVRIAGDYKFEGLEFVPL